MMKRVIIIGMFVALLAESLLADSFTGTVVCVIDGDTIRVNPRAETLKVRLAEIDAPERKQAFGVEAKQALCEKILGKAVRVDFTKKGRYGRIIGTVYLNERNINAELIMEGMAWVYRKYSKSAELLDAERTAREQNNGLWGNPEPAAPWEFRKRRKK